MVRTYAFNASSRSEIFEQYKHTAATPARYNPEVQHNYNTQETESYSNDNRSISNSTISSSNTSQSQNQENNNPFNYFPPLNQSSIYQSSFHSSMIDPIGSIVGLRLIYTNGQLIYVPVEPHINVMINKQFGGQISAPGTILPQIQNTSIISQSASLPQPTYQPHQLTRSQSRSDLNESRASANQQYRNNALSSKLGSGSLPNLAQKQVLSSQEQHKLELQQQIEENRRRREMEKQKELEMEQREIRKWEEYQKRIQEDEEREKRQFQEKARALELKNQQNFQKQQMQTQNRRRRPSVQQQDYQEEEPRQNMRNSNSFSEYSEQRPTSRPLRNQKPRYEQQPEQQQLSREPRPDSSQPRQVEWWEKKPSWQDRQSDRQSAVIPALRGKPPAVPDSQRSGYDSSGNVGEYQSRASSRATSSTQRSHEEVQQSGGRKAPTAFTVNA